MTKERFVELRLTGTNRPDRHFTYWVTGRGRFPFDMLRYDCAWPADGTAAAYLIREDRPDRHGLVSIKMYSNKAPTIDRWWSFGWSVGMENLTS